MDGKVIKLHESCTPAVHFLRSWQYLFLSQDINMESNEVSCCDVPILPRDYFSSYIHTHFKTLKMLLVYNNPGQFLGPFLGLKVSTYTLENIY